jgi:hypothetical protein
VLALDAIVFDLISARWLSGLVRPVVQQAGNLVELVEAGEADHDLAALTRPKLDADRGRQRI